MPPETKASVMKLLLTGFLRSLLRDFVKLVSAFAIGTIAAAFVCFYYGIPLGFSILGGLVVLGTALAFSTSPF